MYTSRQLTEIWLDVDNYNNLNNKEEPYMVPPYVVFTEYRNYYILEQIIKGGVELSGKTQSKD